LGERHDTENKQTCGHLFSVCHHCASPFRVSMFQAEFLDDSFCRLRRAIADFKIIY